ncbi:MAG: pseudouridine synthase [Sphingobium sp.]
MKPPRSPRPSRAAPGKRPPRPRADAAPRPNRDEMARKVAESWGVQPDAPAKNKGKAGAVPARKGKTNGPASPGKKREDVRPPLKSRSAPGRSASGQSTPTSARSDFSGKGQPPKPVRGKPAERPTRGRTGVSASPTTRPSAPRKSASAASSPAAPRASGEPQRIAKLLARAGIASRREIERMIAEGRIAMDGVTLDTPATLLPSLNGVTVDGQPVARAEATRLFLFHKPAGCLTAERDFSGRKTIYDVLPQGLPRLMPVGRLDMTTEGLLLLTNDGELKRRLELPSTGIERSYRARAFGEVSQTQLEELIEGVEVEGIRYGRIDANLERRTGRNQWIELTLTEGKNREVRRVLEYLGLKVNRLIRTRYGPFDLADSEPGALIEIKKGDLDRFLHALKGMG